MRAVAAAAGMMIAALALAADPAVPAAVPAAVPTTSPGAPAAASRLAKLDIEIWPEYDRPAALVFLKGEIAEGAGRTIALRIPAASQGPSASAYSSAAGGPLLNLPYDRADGKDYITVRIQPPERFFHLEFYDRLDTRSEKREYRYSWPGDLAVERLTVQVQQPAGSSGFSVAPELTGGATAADGLVYWARDLGALPAGKAMPITVRYAKSDSRTSKEVLGLNAPVAADAPLASAPAAGAPGLALETPPGAIDRWAGWIPAAIFGALGLTAAGFFFWRIRRKDMPARGGAGYCTQCGNALRTGDRFCSKCGTAVGR